jgi:hypothetical protein
VVATLSFMNELDQIAKKLWLEGGEIINVVDALVDRDRMIVEQRILTLYGVSVNLFGTVEDIKASLEKAKA